MTDNASPIPMLLWCPFCKRGHVDEGEWATRPHKTHLCAHCHRSWRPANVSTVGVSVLAEPAPVHPGVPPPTPAKPAPRTVYVVTERETPTGTKSFWTKVGQAFQNADSSLTVKLDALPLSGVLHVRDDDADEARRGKPMGIDACLFARNAKRYVDIDRAYNLPLSMCLPDEEFGAAIDPERGVPESLILGVFRIEDEGWDEDWMQPKAAREHWRGVMRQFMQAHPGDMFFMCIDSTEVNHWYDVAEAGGYVEWFPAKT